MLLDAVAGMLDPCKAVQEPPPVPEVVNVEMTRLGLTARVVVDPIVPATIVMESILIVGVGLEIRTPFEVMIWSDEPPLPPCVAALIVWFGHAPVMDVIFVPAISPGDGVPVPPWATLKILAKLK